MAEDKRSGRDEEGFDLPVVIARDYDSIVAACQEILLRKPLVVGFDTETSDSHISSDHVSLIQIATADKVYLLQLSSSNMLRLLPKSFGELLISREVVKVGVDIHADARRIESTFAIRMQSMIDIQDLSLACAFPYRSLDGLAQFLLGRNKENSGGGNYEQELSAKQIKYAAGDALLSLHIFHAFFSRPTPKLPPITVSSDEEAIKWLDELRKSGQGTPKKREGWVNMLVNAYQPWVKQIPMQERRLRAESVVARWYSSSSSL